MRRGPFTTVLHHLHTLTGRRPDSDGGGRLLVERFVAGDATAFAELVRRYGPLVWGVCRRVLGHEQDAEDAFQATFLVLARKAHTLRNRAALGGWLQRVAVRIAVQARAESARRRQREAHAAASVSGTDAADELNRQEVGAVLHEELGRLPEKYRSPLVLCYFEGKTHLEAARTLGWPSGTMSRRMGQALDLLRSRLSRRGVGLPAAALTVALAEKLGAAAPAALVESTARVALLCAAGESAAALGAAALAREALRTMLLTKLKVAAGVFLVVGLLGGGAGALLQRGLADRPSAGGPLRVAERPPRAPAPTARTDAEGMPLPEGAIFRFGSARWRHGASINNSALSPDGKRLATAARFSVVVWDLESGKRLHEFPCDRGSQYASPGITFSPDGNRLGYLRGSTSAYVWDLATGKEIWRWEEARRFTSTLCRFTPDGKQLILVGRDGAEYWDLETKKVTRTGPTGSIFRLSPDLTTYARRVGKTLILGELQTGKIIKELELQIEVGSNFAFTPDGRSFALVFSDQEIQVRDLPECKLRVAIPLPDSVKQSATGRGRINVNLGFTFDNRTLLMGTEGDGLIRRWDLATKKELPALAKHQGLASNAWPPQFHCLPDGRTLVSTGEDGLIRRWNLRSGRELSPPAGYAGRTFGAYSADGRFMALGDHRGRLDLWDAATGKVLRTLRAEGPGVARLAFAPDGKTLAVAQAPATVQFYDVPSGKEGRTFQYDGKQEWPVVHALLFSPDGRLLYVGPPRGPAHVWDLNTGELRWLGKQPWCPVFSPDGSSLAVETTTELRYLDAATGQERDGFRFELGGGLRPLIWAAAFAPDGRHLAVSPRSGHIVILDARTGAPLRRALAVDNSRLDSFPPIDVAGYKVRALAFSPDSKWLLSAGSESVLRLWESTTATEVLRLNGHEGKGSDGVSEASFSPDGRSVFSCGADAQGYLWSLKPPPPADKRPEALWATLAGADPAAAYRAVWAFRADPTAAAFLRAKIVPVKPLDPAAVKRLLADLGSDRFATRDAASKALIELGNVVVPALAEARKTERSLEVRQRVQGILDTLKQETSLPELRLQRAVAALELAGTAEARATLRVWAGGAAGARLTDDAAAALKRLERRR